MRGGCEMAGEEGRPFGWLREGRKEGATRGVGEQSGSAKG